MDASLLNRAGQSFSDCEFAEAHVLMAGYMDGLRENIHDLVLVEHTDNIFDVDVSVVVVSHRSWDNFLNVVKTIRTFIEGPKAELICVANGIGTSGAALDMLRDMARVVVLPDNVGCPAARNVGAYLARGEYILFLDDDGDTTAQDLEQLVLTCRQKCAVAVRGRVEQKTGAGLTGPHYDLGAALVPALPTTEGFSVWLASAFERHEGFDPLLVSHEGIELCSRMLADLETEKFLYEPNALMRHDYATGADSKARKEDRLKLSDRYLHFKGICKDGLKARFREAVERDAGKPL
ncbi:MAG: hypothetical protein Tsb0019_26540 [Roseibium sp.]